MKIYKLKWIEVPVPYVFLFEKTQWNKFFCYVQKYNENFQEVQVDMQWFAVDQQWSTSLSSKLLPSIYGFK